MPDKNVTSTTWRSDIMRRMAAIHLEIDSLSSDELPAEKYDKKIKELKAVLAALMRKFLS
jgi:hypothetical protein